MRAVAGRQRDDEQHQAERGHPDADPLAQADLEAEDPLGHTARMTTPVESTAWTTRERGVGERGDVEEPGAGGDGHADREPLAAYSCLAVRNGWRMSTCGASLAPVLIEEAKLRRDGAGQREQDAQIQRHKCPLRQLS